MNSSYRKIMKLFSNPLAQCIAGSDTSITYSCECQEFKPITKLYFCRHCTKLRCGNCVTHEVDSFYCPNCLENMPSAEAKLKKNRCANCFDCPSCGHTLSVRATTVPGVSSNPLDEAQKAAVKKIHYLNCGFCRWTTRDVGLPDQPTPSGGWPDAELATGKKITALLEYYKHVAHHDKMEKERQKISKRRTNMYLMDRYGYSLNISKKRAGSIGSPLSSSLLSRSSSISGGNQKEVSAPCVSQVFDEIEPISDDLYTTPVVLEKTLTLDQKLNQPERQDKDTTELYPKHKHLMVRRSQRCKECEHNLCKPEFNPSSIKFKIQLGGMHYCPFLQVAKKDKLIKDTPCEVIFSVSNPLDTIMNVKFEELPEDDQDYEKQDCKIILPMTSIPIAAKDATVEFDGIGTTSESAFDDDPNIIHSRNSNKVSFYTKVQPTKETGEVMARFKMTYEYKMITAPIMRKPEDAGDKVSKVEEHLVSLTILVQANLGGI